MKTSLIVFTIFLLSHLTLFAQNPTSIQCTFTLEEIALAQPYHRDHPKQEDTEVIATTLFTELNAVYDLVNQGLSSDITSHVEAIESAVNAANVLGMNYAMFQADLEFIESLN